MDPLTQQVPPQQAPQPVQNPSTGPDVPSTPASAGLSQDQMKANLQQLMSKIQSKYQDFSTQKFSHNVQMQKQKSKSLRQLFDLFQSQGVDPNSPEEVKSFLDKIKGNNPELYQQLEQALLVLIGGQPGGPSAEVPDTSTPAIPGTPPITDLSPTNVPATNMNMNQNASPSQNV